jgi:outer membrane protein assembly factor BamB
MTRIARLLAVLFLLAAVISVGSLTVGAAVAGPAGSQAGSPPLADAESEASVRCLPFGLYGEITAEALVDSLSDGSDNLIFLGTSNGIYVVGLDGKLRHFLYSPFGVRFVALIDDITGDGSREVVVVLNDTQVPSLRCYDGATWEKLWQFAPMTKIWDQLWVKRQMGIGSLAVLEDGDSQSVVINSGRSVISVDTKDGTEHWQSGVSHSPRSVTAVADLNGDDTNEVLLTTEDGYLCSLNGNTGEARWRTRLPEVTAYNQVTQSKAQHVLVLDREAGLVAVASTDGSVRLLDLKEERQEWEVSFPIQDGDSPGPMALVPNATPDGRPGILIYYSPKASYSASAKPRMTLMDAGGSKLWDTDINGWTSGVGSYGGKPAIIVPRTEEIKLIDLADGESVVKTIPVSTPDEWGTDVRQIGDDAFLLVGNLTVISSMGEVLWHYPRIANVKALPGNFVGDATEDVLFSAEWKSTSNYDYMPPVNNDGIVISTTGSTYGFQPLEPGVRLLKVMDGATGEIAWSYEVPLSDLKNSGGLKGIEVTADLVGNDGVEDIFGYREDTVFIFSGKDGTTSSFPAGQPVASLDVIRNGASGYSLAVSTASGLMIFDSAGTEIWTTAGEEWVEDETVKFMVLDDLNSDNISDLAVLSAARIVLLRSTDNATGYDLHLTFNPETDSLIEYLELVPDANGDGVKDLAYIQRDPGKQQPGQYTPPGCPLLLKRSPVGGVQLLRLALPARYPTVDLACGDFDGDGCADSLVCYSSYDTCSGIVPDQSGQVLWIISGRDGATIRSRLVVNLQNFGGSGWNINPPATNTGDVTGDGRGDLAWTIGYAGQEYSGAYCHQQRIEIYDVARDESLKVVPTTPLLIEGGSYGGEFATLLPADMDGNGRSEVLAAVSEPSMASSSRGTYGYYPDDSSTRYLAVVDIDGGERLAAFMGFSLGSASVFESHQPGILGVAAAGGAYFLDTNAGFEVTSPADGAKTGPVVPVRWEGTSDGEFVQVFVDGVRNHAGNSSGVDLYLARGRHDIVVRSIDDCGRILCGPSDLSAPVAVKVTPSLWKPILLVLSLFAVVAFLVILFYARLHRVWRARRRAANP